MFLILLTSLAQPCRCGYSYNNCFSSLLRIYAAHTPELLSEAERLLSADPDDDINMSTEDINGADGKHYGLHLRLYSHKGLC